MSWRDEVFGQLDRHDLDQVPAPERDQAPEPLVFDQYAEPDWVANPRQEHHR